MKKRKHQNDSSECMGSGCDAFGNVIDDGASVLGLAYTHDDLSRPIARNDDVFAYNGRSEVTFATISGNVEEHAYDSIGNSLRASFNSVTNHYTANNLNQYTRNPATAPTKCRCGPACRGGRLRVRPPSP